MYRKASLTDATPFITFLNPNKLNYFQRKACWVLFCHALEHKKKIVTSHLRMCATSSSKQKKSKNKNMIPAKITRILVYLNRLSPITNLCNLFLYIVIM